ncbi:MAG: SIS domain-containing protein [Terracidiphilus sp.]|nr:SIS domain-containing protein [Terracidiphilus sp.]MDR3797640.1 SIS domain-containing protein [Terracidiphilus sp.]
MNEPSSTDLVRAKLLEGLGVMEAVAHDTALQATLAAAAEATADALLAGRKLMAAGNGGSAADAQHIAAEFVCRLVDDRPAMRAVALTTNTSILTAVSNDYGFERLFARQVEALGQAGDVFLAISTSGNSNNILRALEQCRDLGIATIGLTGKTGGKMPPLCDYCLRVPSEVTMYIQQAHLALEHIFSLLVERRYFAAKPAAARG